MTTALPNVPNRCADCRANEQIERQFLDEIWISHQGDAEEEADHVASAFPAAEGGQADRAEEDDDEKCRGIGYMVPADCDRGRFSGQDLYGRSPET